MYLDKIVSIMAAGKEYKAYQLCDIYKAKYKKSMSESAMTARLRELRTHPKYKLKVNSRPPDNRRINCAWLYSIPKQKGAF